MTFGEVPPCAIVLVGGAGARASQHLIALAEGAYRDRRRALLVRAYQHPPRLRWDRIEHLPLQNATYATKCKFRYK